MVRLISFALLLAASTAFTPGMERAIRATQAAISPKSKTGAPLPTSESTSVLQTAALPSKLYIPKEKEVPKVLGGLKIGLRKLVVITGASSGLGLHCAATLAKTGRYFVVMAVRDVEKAKRGRLNTSFLRSSWCCPVRDRSYTAIPGKLVVDVLSCCICSC